MVGKAAPQAGVFTGLNPASFNSSDPIVLFIIQATIILIFCRLISIPLGYLRQPRVISEVIAGIILGPTVMGRIPHFQETIFPSASLPFLNLIATIGLVFFLFQVGLEVDLRVIKRDWHKSVSIAVVSMALPFGLGCAVSVGLYKLQNEPSIPFGSFLLFLGVALSITAFPVLARILAELKLLRTKVGAITMAAGLINDCTAWVLLALVVALLNSSGGLEALYIFLTAVGFSLFLIFLVGPLYRKLCVVTHSFEQGPSPLLMTVTLLIVLVSAFVTDIIGIHPIFGGFLAGVIIPHEHDLPIKITEKIEDIVNIIFLPLYFTLSGLKTQIGLLNTGAVWGYVVLVIFLACFGKIVGCTLTAKICGMTYRESLTIGFLMNCKGLVELIVLNIGHDAGVLNDQVFVIMVVMALITTFMTTPVVIYLYPEWYQKQTGATIDSNEKINPLDTVDDEKKATNSSYISILADRYCIVTMLNRIETIPSMMALMQLFNRDKTMSAVEIHALRLLELTQRTSDVMKFKEIGETARQDPVLNVLKTFASLVGLRSLHTHLDFAQDYIKNIYAYAADVDADIVLLPWAQQRLSLHHEEYSAADMEFISQALNTISQQCTVGVFVDKGFGLIQDDGDGLMPQIIVVYEMNDEQEKESSNSCLEFALKLQLSRKVNLAVVGTGMRDEMYATRESIQSYKGEIDKLFTSEMKSNIESKHVKELTVNSILTTVGRPLNKHDLIVIARHSKQTPSSPLSSSQGQSLEVSIFGKLAADLLRQGNASLIIIQARE